MSDWQILGLGVLVTFAGYGIYRFGEDSGDETIKNIGGWLSISPFVILMLGMFLGGVVTVIGFIALPFLFIWKIFS
jgi:hypothetical protein